MYPSGKSGLGGAHLSTVVYYLFSEECGGETAGDRVSILLREEAHASDFKFTKNERFKDPNPIGSCTGELDITKAQMEKGVKIQAYPSVIAARLR